MFGWRPKKVDAAASDLIASYDRLLTLNRNACSNFVSTNEIVLSDRLGASLGNPRWVRTLDSLAAMCTYRAAWAELDSDQWMRLDEPSSWAQLTLTNPRSRTGTEGR